MNLVISRAGFFVLVMEDKTDLSLDEILIDLFMLQAFSTVLLDLPALLFFSTYTLLVLFWAEIYRQVLLDSFCPSICFFFCYRTLNSHLSLDVKLRLFFLVSNKARSLPTSKLRPTYYAVNGAIYFIQVRPTFKFIVSSFPLLQIK